MDAVVTAGGIPQPQDPLYAYSKGDAKALIDIAGKPMIQWVLDALNEANTVDRVVVMGLTEKARLTSSKPVTYVSNQGKLLENLKTGTATVLDMNPKAKYVLFVMADIPAITGPMVDWVVKTFMQTKDDLYYNVIRRESMEATFPTSRRTYTRLKDMEVCGGDMNMARAAIVNDNSEFWGKLIEARKNPAAQASMIGPDIILKFLARQLTIDDVIGRVASKLGLQGRAIICPYPEIGMDVDKPHQLEIMRAYLSKRPDPSRSQVQRGRPGRRLSSQIAPRASRERRRRQAVKSKHGSSRKALVKN